jgi:peptidyl-prolyl cis-trans isomerase C
MNEMSVAAEAEHAMRWSLLPRSFLPAVRGWLREPLIHFLLIGAALFGIYSITPSSQTAPAASKEIRLSLDELAQLTQVFQSQWQREPTPDEFSHLVENKVQQEVLYREALAMGLDKDDEIVKRRMAQKMQFLAEDVAAAHEPTTAELKHWFEKHRAMFALPPRLSFRHLYFSPDRRGARARDDAAQALVKLGGQPEDSKLAGYSPTGSCSRSTIATARRTTSARSSGRSSYSRSKNSPQDRGRGQSNPALAGTWSSSTPRFPAACRRLRRSSPM